MEKRKIIRAAVIIAVVLAVLIILMMSFGKKKNTMSASGTIEVTKIDINSKIAGRIIKLNAKEGDYVKKGELLVELAHDELSAQLEQAGANFKNAEENLKRSMELYKAGSISKQQLDAAQMQHDYTAASLRYIKTNIENAFLTAPVSGAVLSKNAEYGEIAFPGMAILTMGDLNDLWLKIYVPETVLGKIKLGQEVRVTADSYPKKGYKGKITFISSEAEFTPKNIQTKEERTRLVFVVKISVENQNGELKPGMPADAEVRLE